jgi:hypothetical protein
LPISYDNELAELTESLRVHYSRRIVSPVYHAILATVFRQIVKERHSKVYLGAYYHLSPPRLHTSAGTGSELPSIIQALENLSIGLPFVG